MPRAAQRSAISRVAATVSWSVTAIVVRPAAAASSTRRAGDERPSDAVVCRWRSIISRRARAGGGTIDPSPCGTGARRRGRYAARGLPRAALPFDERPVLANEQVEVRALLVGELEEDLLAVGVLEAFAVLLEEAMRAALAADANHERLLVVDAAREGLRAFGEQPVRRALEEEERRPRFELGIAREQFLVSAPELAQMMALFLGKALEDNSAAGVLRHTRRPRVELEAAALGGNRDPQRVAREELFRVAIGRRRLLPRAALLARAIDLHHALRRREVTRRSHFFDECLDVGAEEFRRAITGLADQVIVTGMTVGMLDPETPFAEIALPGDPRVHHPLQRPVDGGAADPLVLPPNQIDEIVRAQVPLLAQKDVEDLLPLAGPVTTNRFETLDVRERGTQRSKGQGQRLQVKQRFEVKGPSQRTESKVTGRRPRPPTSPLPFAL